MPKKGARPTRAGRRRNSGGRAVLANRELAMKPEHGSVRHIELSVTPSADGSGELGGELGNEAKGDQRRIAKESDWRQKRGETKGRMLAF